MNRRLGIAFLFVFVLGTVLVRQGTRETVASPMSKGVTTLISVNSSGAQGNNWSDDSAISADGQLVVFRSPATNLVPGDTNSEIDIFVHNRQTGATTRISVDSSGMQANYGSYRPVISANGRFVSFHSYASNLVPNDTNGAWDVFVHDLQTGTTTRASVNSFSVEGNSESMYPVLSEDGRFVAFFSSASNLVPEDNNNAADVFVHDLETGTTTRASVDSSGVEGNNDSMYPALSANGRFVAFESRASNLVLGDTNGTVDVFIYDRQTETTTRLSVDSLGMQGNSASYMPSMSLDGRLVAFFSDASNLVPGDTNGARDVFIHDRQTEMTTRISVDSLGTQGNDESRDPAFSANGRFVAFFSRASNIIPNDTNGQLDVFVHDLEAGTTTRVSVDSAGLQGNDASEKPAISADGRYVAFDSYASNLVLGDINSAIDIFVHDQQGNESQFSVSGRVNDQANTPVSDVTVCVQDGMCTITDSSGIYNITHLVAGDYTLIATKLGFALSPTSLQVSVPPDATGQDFVATMLDYSISGRLTNATNGNPIPGANVRLDESVTAQTDTNGNYAFNEVSPGEHTVTVANIQGYSTTPASLTVTVPPDATGIDFIRTQSSGSGIELVSVNSSGIQGDGDSNLLGLSADGRYALFHSCSNNFVPGMFPYQNCDILRHDRQSGETISFASKPFTDNQGTEGFIGISSYPQGSMSADGQIIVFVSDDDLLVPGDSNQETDIFIRDLGNDTLTRITKPDGTDIIRGAHSPVISADGNFILFKSESHDIDSLPRWDEDLYLFERATGEITRITKRQAPGDYERIGFPVISDGGRYIVFDSEDPNIIPGSANPNDNLVRVYLYDRIDDAYLEIGLGHSINAATDITPDGRYVLVTSGAELISDVPYNYSEQVYRFDTESETFTLVSFNSVGQPSNDISTTGAISDDGRFIVFGSLSTDLVPGSYQTYSKRVYAADLDTHTITRVDQGLFGEGEAPDFNDYLPFITPDGRYIGFTAKANNLVAGDTNGALDAFMYELNPPADADSDGQSSEIENAAPNGGDGNHDGIPDSQQANVTSLPNSGNGEYVTLATPTGTALTNVEAIDNPAPSTQPGGAEFPTGFIQFGINGMAIGAATTVEIFLEGGVTANSYYKYGPTPDNSTDHWYEFLFDGITGAEILSDKIVLHFVDGEQGDGDFIANGVISDPGAPAILTPPAASVIHLSPTAKLTLSGTTYEDEDILTYDETTGAWSLFFDGSDVGLTKADVSAFEFLGNDDIFLSLDKPMKDLPGLLGITADDSDILRFTPTSTGANTAGTFTIWFDGSDVELTKGGEKIDAITFVPNGDLVISTGGGASVTGPAGTLKAADEDLLRFEATQLGTATIGAWSLYFDTSDALPKLGDVVAAGIDQDTGDILFGPDKKWVFGTLTVNTYDIGRCVGPITGANSACVAVDLFWAGAQHSFGDKKYEIDGFAMD